MIQQGLLQIDAMGGKGDVVAVAERHRGESETLRVAVTGGAGSGKSSVCDRLKALGIGVISADEIAKEIVWPGSPVYQAIIRQFGDKVLESDGQLNRRRLRRIICEDDSQRQALERLIHPEVLDRMRLRITEAEDLGVPWVVVEVPLLFELDLTDEFDMVVSVLADDSVKVRRLVSRDRVSPREAETLIRIQIPDADKAELSDIVINNNESPEDLDRQVERLRQVLIEKVSKSP